MSMSLRAASTQDTVRIALGPQFAQRLSTANPAPYNGIVIDTTAVSLDKALKLLDCLRTIE